MKLKSKVDQRQKLLLEEIRTESKSRTEAFKKLNSQVDKDIPNFINNLKKYRDDVEYNDNILRNRFKEEFSKYYSDV